MALKKTIIQKNTISVPRHEFLLVILKTKRGKVEPLTDEYDT